MPIVPARFHGTVDLIKGAILIASPWLFRFSDVQVAAAVPVVIGVVTILYSLLSDYDLGAVRFLPMTGHVGLGMFGGSFLTVSPWIFNFSQRVYLPHLVLGIAVVVLTLSTRISSRQATQAAPRPG